jgi:hypothetical protein
MIVENMLSYAINMILGAIIGGLIVWIKSLFGKAKAKDVAIEQAVKSLNHDALFRYCRYLIQGDTITEAELENLNHLYATYKALGMNGTGEQMYLQAKNKPIKG